jgi:hypothetical protein
MDGTKESREAVNNSVPEKQKDTKIFGTEGHKGHKGFLVLCLRGALGNHRLQRGTISENRSVDSLSDPAGLSWLRTLQAIASRELEGPRLMSNLWALRCLVWEKTEGHKDLLNRRTQRSQRFLGSMLTGGRLGKSSTPTRHNLREQVS